MPARPIGRVCPREKPEHNRAPDLAQLLGITGMAVADYTLAGRLRLIERLRAAKRAEAQRGRSGSWLYDMNRHLSLCAALREEREALGECFAAEPTAIARLAGDVG